MMWLFFGVLGLFFTCIHGQCDVSHGGQCYNFYTDGTTRGRDDAVSQCNSRRMTLATMTSQTGLEALQQKMRDLNIEKAWLGGKESITDWQWIQDGSYLQLQGCYHNNMTDLQTDMTMDSEIVSPQTCVTECKENGYEYAGVQTVTGRRWCHCGHQHSRRGQTGECELKCGKKARRAGNGAILRCGGDRKQAVYRTSASNVDLWYGGQPNNWEESQNCLAMITWHSYKWGDEKCANRYYYVCQYDLSASSCTANGYRYEDGICYQPVTRRRSWFAAREDCESRSGSLLTLNNLQLYTDIQNVVGLSGDQKWWIGGTNRMWKWTNGADIKSVMWAPSYPKMSNLNVKCMVLGDKGWMDEACNTKLQYYICQRAQGRGDYTTTPPNTPCPSMDVCPTETKSPTSTTSKPCPSMDDCHKYCENGFKKDQDNCDICECKETNGTWSEWSACFPSCGVGVKTRKRTCGDKLCPEGPSTEADICLNSECTAWFPWNNWGACSSSCGDFGTKSRIRSCINSSECSNVDREVGGCWNGPCGTT